MSVIDNGKSFGPTQQDGEWRIKRDEEIRDPDIVDEVRCRIQSFTGHDISKWVHFENPNLKETPETRRPRGRYETRCWDQTWHDVESLQADHRRSSTRSMVSVFILMWMKQNTNFCTNGLGSKYIVHTDDGNLEMCQRRSLLYHISLMNKLPAA